MRHVVEGEGAGVVDAEAVEDVGEGEGGYVKRLARVFEGGGLDGVGLFVDAGGAGEEGDGVGDERVHAVHADEFFG